ncbi:MAG TPA: outer membrane protein assembly factor BamD [Bryobacteraceae bacterium]|nr:outer membrane protein assembly factor BamD [Bryobacteraceae bacterium]
MITNQYSVFHPRLAALVAVAVLLCSCGLRRHKYDNPVTKDTQQPDKVLFDTAVNDIEHSRFERARLTLQTLMNTYDTSEYMAKAKLAVADSWYREGGAHGFAQAEAEYKDFILFYPNMEESAEAQEKICKMQYEQMEKADRDPVHALRAEDECRQLLTQFPNSKFAPEGQQMMRNIQEVLADKEYRVGYFYHSKGSYAAAANRLQGLADQFPLYSGADEALWSLADSYRRMGDKFENQQAASYTRIVRDYPLSPHDDDAKAKLESMKRPVPEADPVAYSRMKYEQENVTSRSLMAKVWAPFSSRPNMAPAAKSGTPQMTGFRPTIPASVPAIAAGAQGTSDVTAAIASDPTALERNPDARSAAAQGNAPAADAAPAVNATPAPPPVVLTRTGIDVNTAPEAQLAQIFGKTTAKRVMAFRPYLSLQDMIRSGISQKVIDRLKPALPDAKSTK